MAVSDRSGWGSRVLRWWRRRRSRSVRLPGAPPGPTSVALLYHLDCLTDLTTDQAILLVRDLLEAYQLRVVDVSTIGQLPCTSVVVVRR